MDVLLHVTTPEAAGIAAGLGRALTARGAAWGCFLTNDGVKAIADRGFAEACKGAARVAVCEHSWDLHMAGRDCPAELGSQTVNSLMMAEATRVVSL
ncbi:hypothetical protein [Marimonas arenosa]|uniref:Uncharacterized protein n=1 Tax=Marimonas arenosa TaxID=1795305 RepID=A0AAE3WC72_9RHOB|nr:hypothetical protein [Marimonas arenosa]MDQ2089745.1 hypothetical protein [Marimonas arenosa]